MTNAEDRINMSANEFFDQWSKWCLITMSRSEGALLNQVLANILATFEERGSVTHHRAVFGNTGKVIFASPSYPANG